MKNSNFGLSKRRLLILTVLAVLIGGIFLGRFLLSDLVFPTPHHPGIEASMVQVTYITRYQKCDDTAAVTQDVGRNQLNLFVDSLSLEWSVIDEQDGSVHLLKVVDDWCPNHKNYRLIKMHRGRVTVFRGQSPDDGFVVSDYKHLEESSIIHKGTLEKLKQGISLFDEDPDHLDVLVRSYLEGITD